MRDYSKIAPQFWTGKTGKAIRAYGRATQVVALYLITCPSATMIGIYHLPMSYLINDTGCTVDEVNAAMINLWECHFAYYDSENETVFVPNMTKFQVGECLGTVDKRHKYIVKELLVYRNSIFFPMFLSQYKDCYHLPDIEHMGPILQAPSKPIAVAVAVAVTDLVSKSVDRPEGVVGGDRRSQAPSKDLPREAGAEHPSVAADEADASPPDDAPKDGHVIATKTDDLITRRLTHRLLAGIRGNNPRFKKPNVDNWAKIFDLIIRVDKQDPDDIADMIDFAQKHHFWYKNVLCPRTLRKHWDRLVVERKEFRRAPVSAEQRDKYKHLEEPLA